MVQVSNATRTNTNAKPFDPKNLCGLRNNIFNVFVRLFLNVACPDVFSMIALLAQCQHLSFTVE
jgi:hypothetical protein